MAIATVNPATGETVRTFDEMSEADVDRRLTAAARRARQLPADELRRAGPVDAHGGWHPGLRAGPDRGDDDDRDGQDAGVRPARGREVRWRVPLLRRACRRVPGRRAGDAAAVGAGQAYATYQPLGPVLAIMPWNFPLWQVMRFAAPGLMAGNCGLLKHASNVPQTALFLEDLFARAGFPDGTFQTLLVGSARVEPILRDERVVAATLTGSGPAGQSVAAIAGRADQEGRTRAGRQRPVHRHAVGRSGPGGPGGRVRAVHQQRPVLHRRQALHRPRGQSTTSSSSGS